MVQNRHRRSDARVEYVRRVADRPGGVRVGEDWRPATAIVDALGRGPPRGRAASSKPPRKNGFEVVPTLMGWATPPVPLTAETYRELTDRLIEAFAGGRARRRRPAGPPRRDGRRRRGRRRRRTPRQGPRPDRPESPPDRLARLSCQRLPAHGLRVRCPDRLSDLSPRRSASAGQEGRRPGLAGRDRTHSTDAGAEQASAPDPPAGSGDRSRTDAGPDRRARRPRADSRSSSTPASWPASPTPTSRRPGRPALS